MTYLWFHKYSEQLKCIVRGTISLANPILLGTFVHNPHKHLPHLLVLRSSSWCSYRDLSHLPKANLNPCTAPSMKDTSLQKSETFALSLYWLLPDLIAVLDMRISLNSNPFCLRKIWSRSSQYLWASSLGSPLSYIEFKLTERHSQLLKLRKSHGWLF